MVILLLLAIPIVTLSIGIYLRNSPPGVSFEKKFKFELAVVFAEILAMSMASRFAYLSDANSSDDEWWLTIALLYCFAVFPSVLAVASLIRRFVFRKRVED